MSHYPIRRVCNVSSAIIAGTHSTSDPREPLHLCSFCSRISSSPWVVQLPPTRCQPPKPLPSQTNTLSTTSIHSSTCTHPSTVIRITVDSGVPQIAAFDTKSVHLRRLISAIILERVKAAKIGTVGNSCTVIEIFNHMLLSTRSRILRH